MIVNLDELNFRELFEVRHDRLRDSVQRPVRLATACKINMYNAICIFEFAVTGKAIEHKREPLIAFHIARTFEEFIQHRADKILCGGNQARHRDFVRQLPSNQTIVICEIDIHFYKLRRTRCRRGIRRQGSAS